MRRTLQALSLATLLSSAVPVSAASCDWTEKKDAQGTTTIEGNLRGTSVAVQHGNDSVVLTIGTGDGYVQLTDTPADLKLEKVVHCKYQGTPQATCNTIPFEEGSRDQIVYGFLLLQYLQEASNGLRDCRYPPPSQRTPAADLNCTHDYF